MSLIKELKSNPENQINLVDVIQSICPVDKTKYVDLLLKLIKKTDNIERFSEDVKNDFRERYGIDPKKFDGFTPIQMVFIYRFIDTSFNGDDLKSFFKFIEYNERGLINDNDLSKLTSFGDILHATSLAEIKVIEKELEKQIKVLHSDSEWVVLRPLTYHSALKYGSSTKWCTSSENNPEYFLRYTKRGILIYMINKISGKKVACFKSLDKEPEFSFWNQIDQRIDSLEADLPDFIYEIIKTEIKNNPVTNFSLLSNEDKIKQEKLLNERSSKMMSLEEEQPVREMVEDTMDEMDGEEIMEEDQPYMMGGDDESPMVEERTMIWTNESEGEPMNETVREPMNEERRTRTFAGIFNLR
jgi:hypothetical protein